MIDPEHFDVDEYFVAAAGLLAEVHRSESANSGP
jgi:hypothetical protein